MKNRNRTNSEIREQVKKRPDLSFKRLLKSKRQTDDIFVLSDKGTIKKIKASAISE
jgi:hypothetical protein